MSTIALIGSDSLLGREIRDVVATSDADIGLLGGIIRRRARWAPRRPPPLPTPAPGAAV
jgi:hypothetical protein